MFKRIIVLTVTAILICFCGCTKAVKTKPVLNNIAFVSQIEYGKDKFVCNTEINNGVVKLVVVKPAEIKDLCLIISENGTEAELKGTRYTSGSDALPKGSVVKILYNLLQNVSENKAADCSDGNCEITGKTDDYNYSFLYSPSGLPISLEIKELNLKIEFKNVTVI